MKTLKKSWMALACLSCSIAFAQPWAKPNMLSTEQLKKKSLNFYDLQEAFNRYWDGKDISSEENENIEEGGYQQFKRAEWFLSPRVFPSGNFHSEALYREFKNYQTTSQLKQQPSSVSVANWTFIGPDVVPNDGGGLGRINCLTFYPGQPDTIFIGAACGGLWRTNDGGTTWSSNTDLLPSLSVSEVVINPNHPDTMYLATGDKYGIYFQYEVTGHYSAGIMISSDGGATWTQTSLNQAQAQNVINQRLIINPLNPSILILASSNGIYRTDDGGTTWSNVLTAGGMFYDVEFNTANPSIVYAVNGDNFYRSTDDGLTWNIYGGAINFGGDRVSIAVTPADANVVYVWDLGNQFYYSGNGGNSFALRNTPNCTPYGYYDNVISVSPLDPNTLYAGGLNVSKSTNGGTSWTIVTDWNGFPAANYTHADHHAIEFLPGNNTTVLVVNDGGIFKTTNGASSWTDLTTGISISQFYRFANDQNDPSLIYTGAQDNGTNRYNGTSWDRVYGADGMECMIDYNNSNNVYVSTQGGGLQKSTDGGITFTGVAPCFGDWTTPYEMSNTNPDNIFSACYDVYESTDAGLSWNVISSGLASAALYCFKIAPSDPDVMYASEFGHIYKTTNHGGVWTEITGTLPVGSAAITFIAIKDINPDELWVTFSGYSAGNKVFYSDNGGATWLNVSGTLPNIPVNCIIYQNNSNDILYIGTDFGAFQTDNTMNDWVAYNTGLPNVIIDELEIQYGVSKLRAATYGRGVWESDLTTSVLVPVDAGTFAIVSPQGTYCDSLVNVEVRIRNYGIDTLTSFDVNYFFDSNSPQVYNWVGSLAHNATVNIILPSATVSPGAHTFTAFTSNPNGTNDNNTSNDSHSSNFFINTLGIPVPIVEGFEGGVLPPANWNLVNGGGLMTMYTGTGGFGTSLHCVEAHFYSVQTGTATLSPPSVNLLNLIPPIKIDFDVAYQQFDFTYHDSLFVDVSTDCGITFTRLYSKGDNTLATTTPSNIQFTPLPNQWRKDTVDITAYAGSPSFEVRFIAKSGFGNNMYLDNINIHGNTVGVSETEADLNSLIYPNPSSGKFYLQLPASIKEFSAKVVDPLGNEVWVAKKINSNRDVIDLSGKARGVYFLEIETEQFKMVKKLSLLN